MFECPVCWRRRRKITTLNCNHEICTFCWDKWKQRSPTCPLCRKDQTCPQKSQKPILLAILFLTILYCSRQSPAMDNGNARPQDMNTLEMMKNVQKNSLK